MSVPRMAAVDSFRLRARVHARDLYLHGIYSKDEIVPLPVAFQPCGDPDRNAVVMIVGAIDQRVAVAFVQERNVIMNELVILGDDRAFHVFVIVENLRAV